MQPGQIIPHDPQHVSFIQFREVLPRTSVPAYRQRCQQLLNEAIQLTIWRHAQHLCAAKGAPPIGTVEVCPAEPSAEAMAAEAVEARLHAGSPVQRLVADVASQLV